MSRRRHRGRVLPGRHCCGVPHAVGVGRRGERQLNLVHLDERLDLWLAEWRLAGRRWGRGRRLLERRERERLERLGAARHGSQPVIRHRARGAHWRHPATAGVLLGEHRLHPLCGESGELCRFDGQVVALGHVALRERGADVAALGLSTPPAPVAMLRAVAMTQCLRLLHAVPPVAHAVVGAAGQVCRDLGPALAVLLDQLQDEEVLLDGPHWYLLLDARLAINRRLARDEACAVVVLRHFFVARAAAKVEVVHGVVPRGVVRRFRKVILGMDVGRICAGAGHLRHQILEQHLVVGLRPVHDLFCRRRRTGR
eukprot:scaffold9380_cov111-Isochrysis_galbana.AAC.4